MHFILPARRGIQVAMILPRHEFPKWPYSWKHSQSISRPILDRTLLGIAPLKSVVLISIIRRCHAVFFYRTIQFRVTLVTRKGGRWTRGSRYTRYEKSARGIISFKPFQISIFHTQSSQTWLFNIILKKKKKKFMTEGTFLTSRRGKEIVSADIHDKSYRVGRRSRYLLVTAPMGTARSPESYKEYICHTHQVESRSRPPISQFPSQLLPGRYRVCTCYVPFTPDLSSQPVYLSGSRINIPSRTARQ